MSREVRYFGPHREPAVLVEDIRLLKAGAVVWWSPCVCGSVHRAMIVGGPVMDGTADVVGTVMIQLVALSVPMRPCVVRDGFCADAVTGRAVADRAVFAVIDEPPAEAESNTQLRTRENA